MRRCLLALALILVGTFGVLAADDSTACNDPNGHQAENIAACDRAIASRQFSGAPLRDLYFNRGKHRSAQRDVDQALVDYYQAVQIDPKNPQILHSVFFAALSLGKIDEALTLAPRVLAVDKTHRLARLMLGAQAIKQKQYAIAQQQFRQSAHDGLTDLVIALLSGWASYGSGDIKAAVGTIDRLSGQDWYRIHKDFHAGLIFDLANRPQDAGIRLEKAYQINRNAFRVAEAHAGWLSRNRDVAAARAVYRAIEGQSPLNPLMREELRRVEAGDKLALLVETPQAGAAEALYGIAGVLAQSQRAGEDLAPVYFQLALYLHPGHDLALLSLADLYEKVKKPELAIEVFRRISTGSLLWRLSQIHVASNLDAVARTEEATRMLRSLIADDPADLVAIVALGDIERSHHKFVECAQTYSSGIDPLPKVETPYWAIFYYRGICRERSRQWSLAEADFRKALELQPDQAFVLNYLGYSLIDQGLKTEEALSLIQRAVAQRPDDGNILDSLGWAYFRTGNFSEAEKQLKRAAELVPNSSTVRLHLGDAFWKMGRRSQARAEWAEALRLKPEPAEVPDIEDRIRNGTPESPGNNPSAPAAAAEPAARVAAVEPARATAPAVTKTVIPAGRRVALVIGNAEYKTVPALANPRRDSRTVADALRQVGFQSVTLLNDATRDKMVEALRAFATEADKADWAMIYYAGHGIEVGGLNYLIPVDARLASDRDVQYEAINLEQVMSAAEGASKLRLVLLDACRDNPFANMMKRSTASRSVGRGLGQVEPDAGMLLVYAAKHGQIAFDGDGQNSPFVSSFIRRITTPQIEIRKLFDLVRDDVMLATKRQQQPFTYGSVPGSEDFYFLTNEVAGKP